MSAVQTKDLWSLALDRQWVDPQELAEAIEEQVVQGDLDYRTRLLIHDSVDGLRDYWGGKRVDNWLDNCSAGRKIRRICEEDFTGEFGFPFLKRSIVEPTRPETIRQFFRDLARQVRKRVRLDVGGSVPLILLGYVSKRTQDIDVVDEVPPEIRSQQKLLDDLKAIHKLELTHFQRHYLPMGWEKRLHSQGGFDDLQVFLVDPYDVILSKMFSIRVKDKQDLKDVVPQLDKEILAKRLKETTQSMLASDELRKRAEDNWFMLFGEPLPS